MNENELQREFEAGRARRAQLDGADAAWLSITHDTAVLAAARDAAQRIHSRRRFWPARLRLALPVLASVALGGATMFVFDRWMPMTPVEPPAALALRVPIHVATRDGRPAGEDVPVEQADPQVWYRYIQELIYSGDRVQAERHLRRFNQLHPTFAYQP